MIQLVIGNDYSEIGSTEEINKYLGECIKEINANIPQKELVFFYKEDSRWWLQCGLKARGYLDNTSQDMQYKNLILSLQNLIKREIYGIILPRKASDPIVVLLDNKGCLTYLLDQSLITDETSGGRLIWFIPFCEYDGFKINPVLVVYDRKTKMIISPNSNYWEYKGTSVGKMFLSRLQQLQGVVLGKFKNGMIEIPAILNGTFHLEGSLNLNMPRNPIHLRGIYAIHKRAKVLETFRGGGVSLQFTDVWGRLIQIKVRENKSGSLDAISTVRDNK